MSRLEVLACGAATVQDGGRFGYRRFGVSIAGAADPLALARANVVVGNPPDAASVEVALAGARFRVTEGPVVVAVAGPGTALELDGRRLPAATAVRVKPGATLAIAPVRGGVYGYLAVAGGIGTEPQMGSRSVHQRSGVGGARLQPGDALPCRAAPDDLTLWRLPQDEADEGPIRLVPGPQDDLFTDEAMAALLSAEWTVSPRSDRMGCRLDGPPLSHAGDYNIVSDGVVPGSIQVPGDARPIVLMRDCQTTGGYPKIATVISADLGRLAQVPPGHQLRFARVSVDDAVAAACSRADAIDALEGRLRRIRGDPGADPLLSENLVSGVVDARET